MKDILMVVHFSQVPGETGNNRFNYLARLFTEKGADVEIVTSAFSHRNKAPRIVNEGYDATPYKFTLVPEPGYKKNVSPVRFYSHWVCGKNLKRYLKKRKKPDCIYCSVPSLSFGLTAARYAKKMNIPFYIDVQDLWPEAYKMVFNIPVLSNVIFYPMKKMADKIYALADKVFAVSETYCIRAKNANKKNAKTMSAFLGTELSAFDEYKKMPPSIDTENKFCVMYLGTLGDSYDINCVIDAIASLKDEISDLKFVAVGDGVFRSKFEEYAKQKGIDAVFTGKLEYEQAVAIMCACDVAVNPIRKKSAASIINKVGDYAAAGLPVINTQESSEYRTLVEEYRCGFNCECSNSEQIADKIKQFYNNRELLEEYSANHRRLAEEKFDRAKTYLNIVSNIMQE